MDIQVVNALNYEEFVDVFGNVVEKCPMITAAVWTDRPFTSVCALEKSIGHFIDNLPRSGKEGILRCHPDLAGRDLLRGTLSPESQGEQSRAGLTSLNPGQRSQFSELNASYKNRFNFPFVISARINDKDTIIQQISSRIHNSPEHEIKKEVKKIGHLRLLDIFNQVPQATKL